MVQVRSRQSPRMSTTRSIDGRLAARRPVTIVFKAGTGQRPLKGLELIHEKLREVNKFDTWHAAITTAFGINVPPKQFFVRTGCKNGERHSLREPIGEIFKEFKSVQAQYVIYLVSSQKREEPAVNISLGSTTAPRRPGPPPARGIPRGRGRGRGRAAAGVNRGSGGLRGQGPAGPSSSAPLSTNGWREPSPSASQASTGPLPIIRNGPAPAAAGGSRGRGGPLRIGGRNRSTEENVMRLLGLQVPPDLDQNGDSDNEDAMSQASQGSIEDLTSRGIRRESIKPQFLANASTLGNSDLLYCREDFENIKTRPQEWNRFKMKHSRFAVLLEILFQHMS